MAEEEGGGRGPRLSKRFSDKVGGGAVGTGEVDYKTKSGTAWSHNYLNQKPWHPLSYPNQKRKWIAEQTYAQRQKRAEEVSREFAQEQEFFRQTTLVSKKEKDKMEMMKSVSFMYIRPPGYNAESAKAAEIADQKKESSQVSDVAPCTNSTPLTIPETRESTAEDKKKNRTKDVFGRALPTEEEFEVLKNAPRLETGAPARVKPFAVEIRNVRCVRCGTYGHQSGDRECPLKDAIMPNDENRLKRDDPLTTIMAQTGSGEPVKWELKQRPGMSSPHGGFRPDDPNQQIVAEDIFDEYGGFLSGGGIPSLTNFKEGKFKKCTGKKNKHKRHSSSHRKYKTHNNSDVLSSSDTDVERKKMSKRKYTRQYNRHLAESEISGYNHDGMRGLSTTSESDYDKRIISNGKHTGGQDKRERLLSFSDSDDRIERRISKRKHDQKRDESVRTPPSSDLHGSNNRIASKSKENVRHHVRERGQPSSSSSSGNEWGISKCRFKKERRHSSKGVSISSDSDIGDGRISRRKHLYKKERHDSSRREICDESYYSKSRSRRKYHRH